jgi:hypothetical protein
MTSKFKSHIIPNLWQYAIEQILQQPQLGKLVIF